MLNMSRGLLLLFHRILREKVEEADKQEARAMQAESEIVILREKTEVLEKVCSPHLASYYMLLLRLMYTYYCLQQENERLKEIAEKLGISGNTEKQDLDEKMMDEYKEMWQEMWLHTKSCFFPRGNIDKDQVKKIIIKLPQQKDFSLRDRFNDRNFRRNGLFKDMIPTEDTDDTRSAFLVPLNVCFQSRLFLYCLFPRIH